MRKLEIINKVSSQTGIDKSDVQETFEAVLITIKEALKNNDSVYIRGFGTFQTKEGQKKSQETFLPTQLLYLTLIMCHILNPQKYLQPLLKKTTK